MPDQQKTSKERFLNGKTSALFLVSLWSLVANPLLQSVEAQTQRTQRVAASFPAEKAAGELLARLAESAKSEGVVDVALQSSLTPRGVAAIQESIRGKYGFDLNINYSPTRSYPKIQAQAHTEHKAGAPPSFDLITGGESHILELTEEGAVERVDWESLLPANIPAEVVVFGGVSVGFKPLDAPYVSQHIVAVRTRARHPSAAKLLAAFLASPDALKIWQEIASNPNYYYRGKSPFDLGPEWQRVRPWLWTAERLRYKSTPEVEAWEREINRSLMGR